MISKLFTTILISVLGLLVFGGGQTFMPIFEWLWTQEWFPGLKLSGSEIQNIFVITNATPGVVGTKFAAFTGYLMAEGYFLQIISMFIVFVAFALPTILVVIFSYRIIKKSDDNIYLSNISKYIKPIIIGILVGLIIKLMINNFFPLSAFNTSKGYWVSKIQMEKASISEQLIKFWDQKWRIYVLYIWIPFVVIESYYLFFVKKTNFAILIISHILLGMLVFQPWL